MKTLYEELFQLAESNRFDDEHYPLMICAGNAASLLIILISTNDSQELDLTIETINSKLSGFQRDSAGLTVLGDNQAQHGMGIQNRRLSK
jgi:hypothetical protein